MILRTIVLALGVCGALAAAQFPAYSQQYLQRLGGAVDALAQVIEDFDETAAGLGMTRAQALEQMQGSQFVAARRTDMQAIFARYALLRNDLELLQGHGPFMRAYYVTRLTDTEIARGTLSAFQPALPLSFATAIFAGFGFVAGSLAAGCCAGIAKRSFHKRIQPA